MCPHDGEQIIFRLEVPPDKTALSPTIDSTSVDRDILNLVCHRGWRRGVLVLLILEHWRLRGGHDLLLLELALDLRGEAARVGLGQNCESLALRWKMIKRCRNQKLRGRIRGERNGSSLWKERNSMQRIRAQKSEDEK